MKTAITVFCICCTALLSKAQTIKQVEYFIDKDKGAGNNTKINLSASADSTYVIDISLSTIPAGLHKLYIRIKDSKGKWSFTAKKNIQVVRTFDALKIISGEYFFDADPGYGKAKAITVSPQGVDITKSFAATTAGLTKGFHKLYVRYKDSLGYWSGTAHKTVEIIRTRDTVKIVAAEYFFTSDDGYSQATAKAFATPLADGNFSFNIPYNSIPPQAQFIFLRVKDSVNNWSLTKVDTFTVQSFAKAASDAIINNTGFSIFPNPASEILHIRYQQKSDNATIRIFDADGKTVFQTTAQHSNNSIDISRLVAGTYILQLEDGDITRTAKFIKQ